MLSAACDLPVQFNYVQIAAPIGVDCDLYFVTFSVG